VEAASLDALARALTPAIVVGVAVYIARILVGAVQKIADHRGSLQRLYATVASTVETYQEAMMSDDARAAIEKKIKSTKNYAPRVLYFDSDLLRSGIRREDGFLDQWTLRTLVDLHHASDQVRVVTEEISSEAYKAYPAERKLALLSYLGEKEQVARELASAAECRLGQLNRMNLAKWIAYTVNTWLRSGAYDPLPRETWPSQEDRAGSGTGGRDD